MIGFKPKDAIKLKEVPLAKQESYLPEEVLPEDGLYRYVLQPGEEHIWEVFDTLCLIEGPHNLSYR